MTKYDQQSSDCVAKLEEAHREQISKLHQSVTDQMDAQPVKWSRELLQHRKRQALMADQRRYREAQATKTAGDALEEEERADRNAGLHASLRRREHALRERQRAERDVLAQRVGSERRKLGRRRDEEVARLAQRNRIILAGVEAKQASTPLPDEPSRTPPHVALLSHSFYCVSNEGVGMFQPGLEDQRKHERLARR